MKIQDDEPESAYSINIVPMIDVIFAILAFFCNFHPIFNPQRRATRQLTGSDDWG